MTSYQRVYRSLSDREHIRLRPGMYIGSTTVAPIQYIREVAKGCLQYTEGDASPAILKMFDEIISNSTDESKREGSKLNTIDVTYDQSTGRVTVRDNGGIPVKENESGQLIPDICFGHLRSGSNFEDDNEERTGVGTNGLGSTLVNILSTSFSVQTADSHTLYKREWQNGMESSTEPELSKCKSHYTEITYIPDYAMLDPDFTDHAETYGELYKERCMHAAIATNVKITFNGEDVDWDFTRFANAIDPSAICITPYITKGLKGCKEKWDVYIGVGGPSFTMVNGAVVEKGTHRNFILSNISSNIAKICKSKHITISNTQIQNNLSVIVNAIVSNPTYSSQTKEILTTPASKFLGVDIEFAEANKVAKMLFESDIFQPVIQGYEDKQLAKASKTTKDSAKGIAKHIPLLPVKTYDHPRELWIFEGDSASDGFYHSRQPYQGCLPIRGKILNCQDVRKPKAIENQEVKDILNVLGILDKKDSDIFVYTDSPVSKVSDMYGQEYTFHTDSEFLYNGFCFSFDELCEKINGIKDPHHIIEKRKVVSHCMKYDRIVISSDADIDGDAICGLLLVMFHSYYPTLLIQGRIVRAITPLLVCKTTENGKATQHTFYTTDEFNAFHEEKNAEKVKVFDIQYKKGLGSLLDEEFKDMMINTRRCYFYPTDDNQAFIEWWGKSPEYRKVKLLQ